MDIRRISSALLGLPLVIIILVFGNNIVVDIAFAIIAAISLHEYFDSLKEKANPVIWVGYLSSALIAFIHIIPTEKTLGILGIIIPLIIMILFLKVIFSKMKTTINDISITFFGISYIAFFIMFIPLVHGLENGKFLVWYILCASWGTDVFGYLIGKNFGKHKFSKISPNKTIEGCIAGVIGAVLFTLAFTLGFNLIFDMNFSYITVSLIAIVLSIIGQIGDFSASSIKRFAEVKDFSNLIPGHGGMLDRFDSVIFIAPFAYILIRIFM